ncbi:MAG: dockerin type I domain-containing protein [Candidatus Zixiibacteriota bacterium]
MADQNTTDQAENMVPSPGLKATGDILWHCDVQHLASPDSDFQIVGIETFRDTIYITGANNGLDPNRVHVWLRTGSTCQYLYSVNQPAASTGWGWRDIAADANYLYSSYSTVLNCFYVTPAGVTLVPANNITFAPLNPIRAVAYDPVNDWFWGANFASNIYAFDRSGVQQASYTNTLVIYGLAFDNTTPGGPYLWCHVQDSCNIYQFSITTGTYTGVVYSGWGDDDPGVSGIAGGLCVLERNPSKGENITLLGITQGSPFDEMYAMEIYVAPQESLYWKPPYEDYAPSGMPDLSQMQAVWVKGPTGAHTFCGPCAVANCFKWFDSKYNQVAPGVPGDGMDRFPLVRQYIDALGGMLGAWDDHDPFNMDHPATPWLFGGTFPPPPTMPQPFVPGPQPPGMPPWGELVERLAWYFNTDGVQTGYCQHNGTEVHDMYQGIQDWFSSEYFENGSTISDTLCVNLWQKPTFQLVNGLVEKCEDVILLLGFWYEDPPGSGEWFRCGGHYVTVAGINSQDFLIAVSDPMFDWAEGGNPGRVLNGQYIPHTPGHDQTAHNDEGNVSHDLFHVIDDPISPGGLWELADYVISQRPWYCDDLSLQNIPDEFIPVTAPWNGVSPMFTEVEYAIQISPWDYRGDVNIPGGDGVVDVGDVVFLINYLFKSGSAPNPLSEGDVSCDGVVDIGDVVTLINYLFKNGNVPKCCDS